MRRVLKSIWYSIFGISPLAVCGNVMSIFLPERRIAILNNFFTHENDAITNMLRASISASYYSSEEDRRSRLNQSAFWGGDSGFDWHQYNEKLCQQDPERQKYKLMLLEMIGSANPKTIVEIGCGLGSFSALLHHSLGVPCVGLDLNPRCIEKARELSEDGLSFFCESYERHAGKGLMFVCSSALEYFSRREVENLFFFVKRNGCSIAICEPVNIDVHEEESTPRGNIAYSHPYPRIAELAGLSALVEKIVPIDPHVRNYSNVFAIYR